MVIRIPSLMVFCLWVLEFGGGILRVGNNSAWFTCSKIAGGNNERDEW